MLPELIHRLGAMISRRLDERGASAIEYAFLVSLIAMAIFVAVGALGGTLEGIFTEITALLPGPP